jgi:hypothetical protein
LILDHLKSLNVIPFILKVGLLITDLSEFKNLNAEYKYYIIRGQHLYITSKKEQLNGFVEIKKIECVPNATILWNLIKEQLKNSIDYCGNKLNLININESEFLEKIEIIYDSRKEVNL